MGMTGRTDKIPSNATLKILSFTFENTGYQFLASTA